MGLLDGLLGQVLGGMMQGGMQQGRAPSSSGGMPGLPGAGGGGMPALIAIALSMLQQNGGLGRVLQQMQQAGYGREADSWVGTGPNEPIGADVLSQIFGREKIDSMARQSGMSTEEAMGGLASVFPEIVNQITPQGRVQTDSDDLVAQALEELKRRQGAGG